MHWLEPVLEKLPLKSFLNVALRDRLWDPMGRAQTKNGFKSPIRAGSLVNMGYKMILSYIKL